MVKSKSSPPASSDGRQESAINKPSDSEDDQPLTTLMQKRKKRPDKEEPDMLNEQGDANKTNNPRRHKTGEKAPKLRRSSPAKTPQKRGRKAVNRPSDSEDDQPLTTLMQKKRPDREETETLGKQEGRRMTSGRATPENTTPKKRGRPKKEDPERTAPSGDGSGDDEPLVGMVKKKRQPQMKQAVVLLKRLSKSDVIDAITRGDTRSRERTSTGGAGAESSDEEPLSHKLKRLKQPSKPVKDRTTRGTSSDDEPLVRRVKAASKRRKRTNGDTPKQESELGAEVKHDSDDECLVKRKSDRAAQPLYRESSS
ncbi:hypothetical protein NFI96_015242 [Prochilodus magdalenae]|nr:hypothetical protein NFI96_015242 [Prochilodus magdalenae]